MKPLELTFRGLNSYCDEQRIDFQELGAHGLFGIFGPTGSGKSTILDAITLALYGTVDRAVSNTRGIINQNEDELHVSFSFELGDNRYVVERTFGRSSSDPEGTRSRYARLHRVGDDGSPQVLGDGVSDTSRAVQELLGLTSDDFLRAVVLPQGKFDEFLKLTGASRGEMLERIFSLEQYGYALQARARDVRNTYERQREMTEVRQEALGDCSDGAVKAARTRLDDCRSSFKKKHEQYETLRKKLQELDKLKELHDRFEQLQAKQKQLAEKDEDIEKQAERLAAANRAEPLREQLRRYGQLAESIESLHEQVGKAQEEFATAQAALEATGQVLETAERERDERLPGLNDRKVRLGAILEEYDELENRSAKLKEKTDLRDGLATKIAELEEQVTGEEDTRRALREKLKELRSQRTSQLVKPDERQKVDAALAALRELVDAENELKRVAVEARGRRDALPSATAVLRTKVEERLPPEQVDSVGAGPELEQLARAELAKAEEDTRKAREVLDQARRHRQAGLLAANLEPGARRPLSGVRLD